MRGLLFWEQSNWGSGSFFMTADNVNTEVIVKFSGDIFKVSTALNGCAEIIDCNFAVLTLPLQRIDELLDFGEVEFFETAKNISASPIMHHETGNTGIRLVRNGKYNLKGRGVIIGIIDSGIDFTHKEFITEDNSTRILYIWDQSVDGNPPDSFIFGAEYDRNIINSALNSVNPHDVISFKDYIGHGTAVAGIAAGNSGIAPEASIISVKLGHNGTEKTTDILRGVKYLIDKAKMMKRPLVINISYGMNIGSHSGDSLFEECLNSLCSKWKTTIVAAAGNEGGSGHHFSAEMKTGKNEDVEFVCPSQSKNLYLDIWKSFNDNVDFELIAPTGVSSGIINARDSARLIHFAGCTITVIYKPVTFYSRKQEIVFLFDMESFIVGVWRLRIFCRNAVDGRIDLWLPTVAEVSENTSFLHPDNLMTLTLPSTVENVISVGGYSSLLNSIAVFSGKGGYGLKKPDITAPAVDIYSCKSGGGYDLFSGTSMAAPFISGSAALMMEWGITNGKKPFLYGQMLKAYLIKGAVRNGYINYHDSSWGYGTLNLNRTMELLEGDL